MARVKKGVNAHKRHKNLKISEGLLRHKEQGVQSCKSGSDEILKICIRW